MSDETNSSGGPEPASTGWQTVNTPGTSATPAVPADTPVPAYPPPPPATFDAPPVYAAPPAYAAPPVYAAPPKKRKVWLWVLLGIFTFIVLGIVGCIAVVFHVAKTIGSDSAIALHFQMQANDLAGIYAAADPAYKESVTRAKSDAMFTQIHDQLGAPVSGTQTSVNIDNDVKTLVNTEHFAKGDGTETMKFHKGADGIYRLLSYDVKSPLLLSTPTPATPPPASGDGSTGEGSSSGSGNSDPGTSDPGNGTSGNGSRDQP